MHRGVAIDRLAHTMVYDIKRHRMVVFGGWGSASNSSSLLNDTHVLCSDCYIVGEGHAGGGLPISCLTAPVIGKIFRLAYFVDKAKTSLLFIGSAHSPPGLKLTTPLVCRSGTLHVQPLSMIPLGPTPSILVSFVPNNPILNGSRFTLQGVSPQPTGCFLLSDALELAIRY